RETPIGSWWRPKLRPDLGLLQVLFFAVLFVMPDGMSAKAQPILSKTDYAAIPGWKTSPLEDALAAFRKSCSEIMADGRAFKRAVVFGGEQQDWLGLCQEAARATDARD